MAGLVFALGSAPAGLVASGRRDLSDGLLLWVLVIAVRAVDVPVVVVLVVVHSRILGALPERLRRGEVMEGLFGLLESGPGIARAWMGASALQALEGECCSRVEGRSVVQDRVGAEAGAGFFEVACGLGRGPGRQERLHQRRVVGECFRCRPDGFIEVSRFQTCLGLRGGDRGGRGRGCDRRLGRAEEDTCEPKKEQRNRGSPRACLQIVWKPREHDDPIRAHSDSVRRGGRTGRASSVRSPRR